MKVVHAPRKSGKIPGSVPVAELAGRAGPVNLPELAGNEPRLAGRGKQLQAPPAPTVSIHSRSQMDEGRSLCALTCPFCRKQFILTFVYNTHLLGHIAYHSNQIFECKICDFQHEQIGEVGEHIERTHSVKHRILSGSDEEKQILEENEKQKSEFISILGHKDKPAQPLNIPY